MDNTFQIIEVHGQSHVVKQTERKTEYFMSRGKKTGIVPDPNYLGTRKCLCGVLKDGQSLIEFINEYKMRKLKRQGKQQLIQQ